MKVTFDSNAWEPIFSPVGRCHPIKAALQTRRIEGFICDAAFRIEAIRKKDRSPYFSTTRMDVRFNFEERDDGMIQLFSLGPADNQHSGLPKQQAGKLAHASASGVKLLRMQNWTGVPNPPEINDVIAYVAEDAPARRAREQRQIDVFNLIDDRGLGHSFFLSNGGWEVRERSDGEQKTLAKACAEWADGELVAAHIAYGHDILCTEDYGVQAGRSIFDAEHRAWLANDLGLVLMNLHELQTYLL